MSLDEKKQVMEAFGTEGVDTYLEEDVKKFIKIVEGIMMNTGISRRERVERLHYEAGKGLI